MSAFPTGPGEAVKLRLMGGGGGTPAPIGDWPDGPGEREALVGEAVCARAGGGGGVMGPAVVGACPACSI